MIVQANVPFFRLTRELWPIITLVTAYSVAISLIDYEFRLTTKVDGLATLPGALIGILLAFRTSACYNRWWEARILWGKIVNDSRSWTRQLLEFATPSMPDGPSEVDPALVRMAHRQIAWCYTLTCSLRGKKPLEDVGDMLSEEELAQVEKQKNVPNALLLNQARDLRALRNQDRIDAFQFVRMEDTLTRLTDSMGGCERIRNTPFPQSYQLWIKYMIYLFIVFLPFALVELPWYGLILVTVPIASGFLIIDRVATYLEDPFLYRVSSTPMLTLSRTIEINIRQMLDEPDVPPMMEPDKGVLY
ncbi:MAG: hypothetical protein MK108_00575 [Mariniblastus sp.]|nr:hypothetical protein [Mariniblastus sp.]